MPKWFNGLNVVMLGAALTFASVARADSNDPWQVSDKPAPMSLHNTHQSPPITAGSFDDEPAPDMNDDAPMATDSYDDTSSTTSSHEPILWEGFLYGDQHFRDKPRPIGSPLYFEDPFINSDLRPIYLWHKFPGGSALRGGQLSVYAMQARLALTDRLQLIATSDGYSRLDAGIIPKDGGWNDIALGLKYALWVDHDSDFILSSGLRWKLSNGHNLTLQGGVDELSPFLTMYKGCGKWNTILDVVYRLPTDWDQGNSLLSWDAHVSYELFDDFFPLIEVHGVHYLTDGDRLPLDVGGLDYANIGSNDVAGQSVFWGGVGFRWNLAEHVQFGAAYEFPLQNPDNNDIFDQRVTTSFVFTF